jgi:hypothetical protein
MLTQPPTIYLGSSFVGGGCDRLMGTLKKPFTPLSGASTAPIKAPVVRLAHTPGAQGDGVLMGIKGNIKLPADRSPALLVSFYYLKNFLKYQKEYQYRDWALDSGAFSAHSLGKTIDLIQYIECCKNLRKTDKSLAEIFALDVIGDWKASIKNTERMWAEGIPAIPCYHFGEPEAALMHLKKNSPKIALGGCAKMKGSIKNEFVRQCFSRVWPHKVHGFGFGSESAIMGFPFHSVDSTSWELAACGFGNWRAFGKMSLRGSSQNLRSEVEWYLNLEAKARTRWRNEMILIDKSTPAIHPAVQLGVSCQAAGGKFGLTLAKATHKQP